MVRDGGRGDLVSFGLGLNWAGLGYGEHEDLPSSHVEHGDT